MTTFIKRREEMQHEPLNECHEGVGALDWVNVLGGADLANRNLRFFHDNILEPGTSVGVHEHTVDEEYYYIVSGSGTMTLDDQKLDVKEGDITAVYPGGKHGLENTSDKPLRFIVVSTFAK